MLGCALKHRRSNVTTRVCTPLQPIASPKIAWQNAMRIVAGDGRSHLNILPAMCSEAPLGLLPLAAMSLSCSSQVPTALLRRVECESHRSGRAPPWSLAMYTEWMQIQWCVALVLATGTKDTGTNDTGPIIWEQIIQEPSIWEPILLEPTGTKENQREPTGTNRNQ